MALQASQGLKAPNAAQKDQNTRTHMRTYDVIIPARNEAPTIAGVVAAARAASRVRRVIVVDDHSTDATAALAAASGAEVLVSRGEGSKALALATGVAATDADVLVFFDGDITGATPAHFDRLATPVQEQGFAGDAGEDLAAESAQAGGSRRKKRDRHSP